MGDCKHEFEFLGAVLGTRCIKCNVEYQKYLEKENAELRIKLELAEKKLKKEILQIIKELKNEAVNDFNLSTDLKIKTKERDEARQQVELLQDRVDSLSSQLVDELSDRQKHLSTIASLRSALEQISEDIDSAECRDDLDGIRGFIDEALATPDTLKDGDKNVT